MQKIIPAAVPIPEEVSLALVLFAVCLVILGLVFALRADLRETRRLAQAEQAAKDETRLHQMEQLQAVGKGLQDARSFNDDIAKQQSRKKIDNEGTYFARR